MAVDTYTARGRFVLQGTGNNLNTWGQIANSQAIQPIEDMIAGAIALTVSGNVTLTANNGAPDQARMSALQITGTGGTITTPGVQKHYRIDASAATGPVTITTGAGTSAIVPAGLRADVFSPDGVSFYLTDSPTSRAYTDAAVLKANAGNLPGGSVNGQALFTRNGAAAWDYIAQADVTGLATRLAYDAQTILDLQQNLTRTQIGVAKALGTVVITTMGYSDGFQDQSGIDTTNSVGIAYTIGKVSNLNQVSTQPPAAMTANTGTGANSGYNAFSTNASATAYQAFDQTSTEVTSQSNSNGPGYGLQRPTGVPVPTSYTLKNSATAGNVWLSWQVYGINAQPASGPTSGAPLGPVVNSSNSNPGASSTYAMPSGASAYTWIYLLPISFNGNASGSIQEISFGAIGNPGAAVLRSKLFTTTAIPKTATLTVFAKTPSGNIVPNTDMVGKITRNGATSFVTVNLTQVGSPLADGSIQYEARNVDLTGTAAPGSLTASFGSEVDMTATREIDIIDVTLSGLS